METHGQNTRVFLPISSVPFFFSSECWVVCFPPVSLSSNMSPIILSSPFESETSPLEYYRFFVLLFSPPCVTMPFPVMVTSVAGERFAEGVETSKDSALQSEFVDQ